MADGAPDSWVDRHGVTVSQCVKCVHWRRNGTCASFPDGVPMAILANTHDHTKPLGSETYLYTPIKTG